MSSSACRASRSVLLLGKPWMYFAERYRFVVAALDHVRQSGPALHSEISNEDTDPDGWIN